MTSQSTLKGTVAPLTCCPGGFRVCVNVLGEEDSNEDEDDPDGAYPDAFLAHELDADELDPDELDPDDDVGLYVEDDEGLLSDGLADLEDSESGEEWEEEEWEEWGGPGAANVYQRNLMRFRVIPDSFALH